MRDPVYKDRDKPDSTPHVKRMADALYTKDILRLAADIPLLKRLEAPDYSVSKVSPICGSRVQVDTVLANGLVTHYGQEVRACALGQASAAIAASHVIGRPIAEFPALLERLRAFLKGSGPCPEAPWDALDIFAPAKDHKSRHASILLPFDAMAQIAQMSQQPAAAQ